MKDTPSHIEELHRKLWFAKTPGERLSQFLQDNDALLNAIDKAKASLNIKPVNRITLDANVLTKKNT